MSFTAILITLVLLLCYAIGILLFVQGVKQIRSGLAARRWPTTAARLGKCVVERAPSGGNVATYHVSVKYSYSLAGKRYSGDSLAIGYGASSNREAHEMARRKVLDMERFVIRYDPEQPETSTIFASENALLFGTVCAALFWLILTTCFTTVALIVSGIGPAVLAWLR